jgi:hypothetical protein
MDRCVARVVQYLTYSVAGQESGDMLSRAKGLSATKLINLYADYINILGWSDRNPCINPKILLALRKVFWTGGDDILHPAGTLFGILQRDIQRAVMLQGVSIQYGVLRTMPICVIADSQAGIRLAEYDWYSMSSSMKTRVGYLAIEDVNVSRYADSSKVVRRLVDILLHPLRNASFHIFWSLTPENTGFGTNRTGQLAALESIVTTLTHEGHTPYICIDQAKNRRFASRE